MQDTDLYKTILGIEHPWYVATVNLDTENQRVDVYLAHDSNENFQCIECGADMVGYDHTQEREWRHLNTCQFLTVLHARIPRGTCPEHGVRNARVSWAEPGSRFTCLMERWIIDVIRATKTLTGATRLLGISWDQAMNVMERAVERGNKHKEQKAPTHIGVDEKSYKKGQNYATIISDLQEGRVVQIEIDRKEESLDRFYESLEQDEIDSIEAVAMDMWKPYIQSTREHLEDADSKIIFDRFHIMQAMNKAVNKVRSQEHKALSKAKDDTLKGTRFLWLYAEENIPEQLLPKFEEVKSSKTKTARAWAIKEALRNLWDYKSKGWARRYFDDWYAWAIRSRIPEIKAVARTIKSHLDSVISYCNHQISNGPAEGINSQIMAILRACRGIRNVENLKTVILFHLGDLKLYPR